MQTAPSLFANDNFVGVGIPTQHFKISQSQLS